MLIFCLKSNIFTRKKEPIPSGMSPLKESDSFLYLFNLQPLENLYINFLHFLRHLDNHLLVYALKRFLICCLFRKQHRLDDYRL